MKIVVLMGALKMGGAERVAVTLSSYLAQKVDTYLICFDKNKPSYEIDKNIKFINNKENYNGKLSGICGRIKFLKKTLREINPDIIFTMFYDINIYALIYKILYNHKVKIISSERCNPHEISCLSRFLSYSSSLFCNGFVFQTAQAQEMYPKITQRKSVVIHNAISNPLLKNIDLSKINKTKTITTMGRLERQKDYETMIKACIPVFKQYPDYKLMIYGEGSKQDSLTKLIKDNNLEKNVFLEGNKQDAIKYVASSEIFLLTSLYEGMPNALIEAMALGIPVISTDCKMGPGELIVDGMNGFLVPVGDVSSISNRILELLKDAKLRKKISNNCLKIRESHSIDKIYGMYLNYFMKVKGDENEKKNI